MTKRFREKPCVICGKLFQPTGPYAKYCCKACATIGWKSLRSPESIKAKLKSQKAWVEANKERAAKTLLDWRKRNKERLCINSRNAHLKKFYGLDIHEYSKILTCQKGGCAICSKPPGKRSLAVDHCHQTKAVRGLLCQSCNIAIGLFKDDPDLLKRAIHYLNRSPKWKPKK